MLSQINSNKLPEKAQGAFVFTIANQPEML